MERSGGGSTGADKNELSSWKGSLLMRKCEVWRSSLRAIPTKVSDGLVDVGFQYCNVIGCMSLYMRLPLGKFPDILQQVTSSE